MRKRIMILGLLLFAVILSGCGKQQVPAPPLQEPVGVQPDKVAAYIGDIYDVAYFNSAVVPYAEGLSFEIDGAVAEICFYPGMVVEKGDVLAKLDMSGTEQRVRELKAELEHMGKTAEYEDTVAQLDIDLMRLELKQLQQQGTTEQEIKLKENEIAQKEAALRQTRQLRELDNQAKNSELEKLNRAVENDSLRAPFSGQILSCDVLHVGAQIRAFDPIVFIADNTRLQMCGEYIKPALLRSADTVVAHIGDTQYEIREIPVDEEELTAAALENKTVQTRFDFVALESKVEAGNYAAILVYTDYIRDALLIPRGAVLTDATGNYVYVDDNGDRVRREVNLGKVTDSLAQITEGLREGEVVYVK